MDNQPVGWLLKGGTRCRNLGRYDRPRDDDGEGAMS